jgi:hypothetical protein
MGSRAVRQLRDVRWYRMACLAFCLTCVSRGGRLGSQKRHTGGVMRLGSHYGRLGRFAGAWECVHYWLLASLLRCAGLPALKNTSIRKEMEFTPVRSTRRCIRCVPTRQTQRSSWALTYISDVNSKSAGAFFDLEAMTADAMKRYLRLYCHAYPSADYSDAVEALMKSLPRVKR